MSWSSRARPVLFAAILVGAGAALGACSFSPVYSGALASSPTLDLAYAKPATRLEQIIYQELELRLGSSASPTAPLVTVSVSTAFGGIGGMTSTGSPSTPSRATVTATLTITQRDGSQAAPMTITRAATAEYTTNSQVLANNSASVDASERAARAAAESLRLAILAELSRG